jgi:hypothetical protein
MTAKNIDQESDGPSGFRGLADHLPTRDPARTVSLPTLLAKFGEHLHRIDVPPRNVGGDESIGKAEFRQLALEALDCLAVPAEHRRQGGNPADIRALKLRFRSSRLWRRVDVEPLGFAAASAGCLHARSLSRFLRAVRRVEPAFQVVTEISAEPCVIAKRSCGTASLCANSWSRYHSPS